MKNKFEEDEVVEKKKHDKNIKTNERDDEGITLE